MPTAVPGMSSEATKFCKSRTASYRKFPEVENILAKLTDADPIRSTFDV